MTAALNKPHRRYNSLTGEYVLVSPQRTQRPWIGQVDKPMYVAALQHDPACYLCPGNARTGGAVNPNYSGTYIFANDFPALLDESNELGIRKNKLIQADPVRGACRVICYSPRHDLTLATMNTAQVAAVVEGWIEQTAELGHQYAWVQLFQNQGAMMGASNPHPHGQVWALNVLPNEALKEDVQQRKYLDDDGAVLLLDYLKEELQHKERIVLETDHWVVVVPFWAIWPFETLLMPKRHVRHLPNLTQAERADLAAILCQLTVLYDNLFETPFPYSMGWHGAPFVEGDQAHWQLHAHFYPPLLRSAEIKKFMVGYELLAEAQRDLTAEAAAERLASLSRRHYLQGLQ